MSLPQHIQYGIGGTITIDLESLPTNAIGVLRTEDGTSRGTITGTVSTIDTVLNVAATRGDSSISVSSNVGMVAGGKFWIQDDPEEVLVRKIDDCNIYLRRRLLYDHVNSATVEGSRVSFTANAAVANRYWWDGHLDINVDGGSYFIHTAVECTRYPTTVLCSTQDILDIEPALYQLLDDSDDIERLKDMASQYLLSRFAVSAPDLRARVFPGSSEFSHANALVCMMMLYGRQHGDEAAEMYARYKERVDGEIQRVSQTTPRDSDQDRDVELDERINPYGGKLVM